MAEISLDEVSYDFELPNFEDIPESIREELLTDVGNYLIESILDYVGEGKTPVAGGEFQRELSEAYARQEGKSFANLDREGDMLQTLKFNIDTEDGIITLGIFDEDQTPKAYNHNVGDTLPKRQFIPDEDELFKAEIIRGVGRIIQEYLNDGEE